METVTRTKPGWLH